MDKVIYGPEIYTMNEAHPRAEAIGISGGRVEIVGSREEVSARVGEDTEVLTPDARTLFPGFVDAHVHFLDLGLYELRWLDLSDTSSKGELLGRIEDEVADTERGEWIIGMGWDESKWSGEGSFPDRYELDGVAPHNPVALQRVDMHTFCVNSRTLAMVEPGEVEGAKKTDGEYNGILTEEASFTVRKEISYSEEDLLQGLRDSVRKAGELGVTSIHQMPDQPGRFEEYFRAYQALDRDGELNVRSCLYYSEDYLGSAIELGLERGFGGDRVKVGGLKLFSDGAIGSRSALVSDPYAGTDDERGIAIYDYKELRDLVKRAETHGVQVVVHAIGDQAIERVARCFAELGPGKGRPDQLRHRIEHLVMATDDQVKWIKDLGLVASLQPNFTGNWGLPGGMYEERLGREKLPSLNRFALFRESGVDLAFGSDGMPFDPLYGIHWAVNSPFESARMEPEEAIKAYTLGGAFAAGDEDDLGSIEAGKYADFVLLDGNPLTEPEEIKHMEVKMTVFDGEVVFPG
ncbi:MAG: amidohydrolase [Candidatus Acetothermia bacterium]